MAKQRSTRWKRLRDSIALDPGRFAGGSAVIDTFGLLAYEGEQLAARRRSEGLGMQGRGRDCERPVDVGNAPWIRCGQHRVRN
jgi:hypothetical protein